MPDQELHPIVLWARKNKVSSMSLEFDESTGKVTGLEIVFDPKEPDVFDEFDDMRQEQKQMI